MAELDGTGQVVARFVYGANPLVPAYIVKNGATYRALTDHLGSPRLVVDTATGAVVQRRDYDAWGRVTLDTNLGFQPFGFAGISCGCGVQIAASRCSHGGCDSVGKTSACGCHGSAGGAGTANPALSDRHD